MEFNGEMGFGRTGDRWVEIRRFPATWSMGLAKEGSRRKLRRWVSFSRSGFGIHGEELTDSAGERKLLNFRSWRREEEENEQGTREPKLELENGGGRSGRRRQLARGAESCSTAGTRQRPAGSSVTAWATARRRFPIGYGLFPVRSLVVDGWCVAQLAGKSG